MRNFVASGALLTSRRRRVKGIFRQRVFPLAASIDRAQWVSANMPVLQPVKPLPHGHFPAQQREIVPEFGGRSDATLHRALSQFAGLDSGPSESSPVASLRPSREIYFLAASRSISKLAYERQPEPNPGWVARRLALR